MGSKLALAGRKMPNAGRGDRWGWGLEPPGGPEHSPEGAVEQSRGEVV